MDPEKPSAHEHPAPRLNPMELSGHGIATQPHIHGEVMIKWMDGSMGG
jgi:hypothetical protein